MVWLVSSIGAASVILLKEYMFRLVRLINGCLRTREKRKQYGRPMEQVGQTFFACLNLHRPGHWAYLFQFDYDPVHSSFLRPVLLAIYLVFAV